MTHENELNILIADSCTASEAEKHLKNGTIIFEDLDTQLESYLDEWDLEEDYAEKIRQMVRTGKPAPGWGVVAQGGKTYFIEYAL